MADVYPNVFYFQTRVQTHSRKPSKCLCFVRVVLNQIDFATTIIITYNGKDYDCIVNSCMESFRKSRLG